VLAVVGYRSRKTQCVDEFLAGEQSNGGFDFTLGVFRSARPPIEHCQLEAKSTLGLTAFDLGGVSGLEGEREDLGSIGIVSSMAAIEGFLAEKRPGLFRFPGLE
jgi:hypothetical protein